MLQKSKFAKENVTYSAGDWQIWAIAKLQSIYTGDIRKVAEFKLIGQLETAIGTGKISRQNAEFQFVKAIAK